MTPVTCRIVAVLERAKAVAVLERAKAEDWYDRNIDFSPFHIRV